MKTVLDENIAYGKNPMFIVGISDLKIISKNWFRTRTLKVIPIADIESIKYVHPYGKGLEKYLTKIVAFFLGMFMSHVDKYETDYVEITYKVNGDTAATGINSKISQATLMQLKKHISEIKKRLNKSEPDGKRNIRSNKYP